MAIGVIPELLAVLVADPVSLALRGIAYAIFNFLTGLALLGTSFIAGAIGPSSTFLARGRLHGVGGSCRRAWG